MTQREEDKSARPLSRECGKVGAVSYFPAMFESFDLPAAGVRGFCPGESPYSVLKQMRQRFVSTLASHRNPDPER